MDTVDSMGQRSMGKYLKLRKFTTFYHKQLSLYVVHGLHGRI